MWIGFWYHVKLNDFQPKINWLISGLAHLSYILLKIPFNFNRSKLRQRRIKHLQSIQPFRDSCMNNRSPLMMRISLKVKQFKRRRKVRRDRLRGRWVKTTKNDDFHWENPRLSQQEWCWELLHPEVESQHRRCYESHFFLESKALHTGK